MSLAPHTAKASSQVYDLAVVGGGLVGTSIAYGLRGSGQRIAVLDEGDVAFRASRGNFGLVWVQSKGMGMSAYGRWTLESARLWPSLAAQLLEHTGIDVGLEQKGGLYVLFGDKETEARVSYMTRMHAQPGMASYPWSLLDRHELVSIVPGLGPEPTGAIWTGEDGILNPLKLLRALHQAMLSDGVHYLAEHRVADIEHAHGVFQLKTPHGTVRARQIVLASGLGNQALGEKVGIHVSVKPQRGQILVLERTRRMLPLPFVTLRQTDEGTWLVGDSQEDAGYADDVVTLPVLATLADRAVRTLPALRDVRVVRSWSALRVKAADGFPVYEASQTHPGAFLATCHSGVTLGAAHALRLAPMIAQGSLHADLAPFSARRFDVQKA
jgi:glycine/D-amino acid oxidase-like deaminating enzyme